MRRQAIIVPNDSLPDVLQAIGALAAVTMGSPCDVTCSVCTRQLAVLTATHSVPHKLEAQLVTLRDSSYCRWCARPITAEAENAAPLDGYVRIARRASREVARHHPAAARLE